MTRPVELPDEMPCRRRVLLGGTSLCLGSLTGCLDRSYADQEPHSAGWPVSRQNARNTGSVPDASLSADPIVQWRRSFPASDSPSEVIATDGAVYVARQFGTSVLDPESGERAWQTDGDGQTPADGVARAAGVLDGTLYTADGATVRAYDAEGRLQWRAGHPDADPGDTIRTYCLLPTPDAIFWGTLGRLDAYDRDGDHQWSLDPRGSGGVYPAVADGRLYVAAPGALLATSRPGVLGDLLGVAPSSSWRAETPGWPTWPVVTRDRIVLGDRDRRTSSGSHRLVAIRSDGSSDWTRRVVGPTSHLVVSESAGMLACAAVDEEAGDGVVSALDVDSGEAIWTREDLELTDEVGSIGLAGETLVVAGFDRASEKPVHGLALSTGETQWTQTVRGHPTSMAVAGDRLYLGTSLGNLVAFG